MRWEAAVRMSASRWEMAIREEDGVLYLCSWPYRLNTVEDIVNWLRKAKGRKAEAIDPTHDQHDDWEPLEPKEAVDALASLARGITSAEDDDG